MSLIKDFDGQIFKKLYLRMGGPIDIEQRGWEVIHYHERDHVVTKVRCKDLPNSDQVDFRCQRVVDSSSFSDIDLSFYPLAFQAKGVLSLPASVRPSVRPSVRKLYLVRTITLHKFQLESPNLQQTCILGYSWLV